MTGPADSQVTLANWQDPPFNRWAFQHVRELIPSARIARKSGAPRPLPRKEGQLARLAFSFKGQELTVGEFLERTWTDGFLVLHDGAVITEQYFDGMRPETPHLLMSISKSVTSTVAGILAGRSALDPAAEVTTIVPELAGTSFAGATVQHLLDMRTGTRFNEDYADLDADVRSYERIYLWRPADGDHAAGLPATDAISYFSTLQNDGPHGGPFRYRSILTDVLAWVIERAAAREDPGDGRRDRFRDRHQQVRRLRPHAVEILLGDHRAVVQDQEPVGPGPLEELTDRQLLSFEGERKTRELALFPRQRPRGAGLPGNPGAGDELPHVLERPSVERRVLPVRQRDL
ncbi:MAG TPA: serine hydrolase [Streptosporangiaceae bacterium]